MQLDIVWDVLCVEISLLLSEISRLRRSISKTHFRGFLDIYQNLRHVKPRLIILHMVDGTDHSTLFRLYLHIYLPLSERHFWWRMTRQRKSLFRWYNAMILSKHTLESYFGLHRVCNDYKAHKMMCEVQIQTFRPIFLYFDSNRLRGLHRVPSESTRRLIIESSFEQQSRSPTYLNMTCVQE